MAEVPASAFPVEIVTLESRSGSLGMVLDETIYPLDAIYGASYIFIDRAYVLLDRLPGRGIRVTLASKSGQSTDETLRALAGEFANELLSCAWRHEIVQQNRAVIEVVTTQALSGALGPPSLEELEKFDFTEGGFEDPLGIAVSWEEKYGKKLDALSRDAAPVVRDGGAPSAAQAPEREGER